MLTMLTKRRVGSALGLLPKDKYARKIVAMANPSTVTIEKVPLFGGSQYCKMEFLVPRYMMKPQYLMNKLANFRKMNT